MKVVLRSSSLLFTVACIALDIRISRVNRKIETLPEKKPAAREENPSPQKYLTKTASN